MNVSRLLRRPKQQLRALAYPVQRRLPITLERDRDSRAVMVFDPSTKYGGWVDRVKGMISVYELSRLTGRSFRVSTGPAFPLEGLVEPATFDWRIAQSAIRWHPLDTWFHVSRDYWTNSFPRLRHSRRKTLFVETNLDYLAELHPDLDAADVRRLWGQRYRELFELAPALEREVQALVDERAVAVHARFTTLLGDFKDITSRVLAEPERSALLDACVKRVAKLARGAGRMIVFSDSITFLRSVDGLAPNITIIPGEPTHLDHQTRVVDSLSKTLLDFHVMVRCARIVQLRLPGMYDSNFSRYASYVRDIPFIEST